MNVKRRDPLRGVGAALAVIGVLMAAYLTYVQYAGIEAV